MMPYSLHKIETRIGVSTQLFTGRVLINFSSNHSLTPVNSWDNKKIEAWCAKHSWETLGTLANRRERF
jgi:hypothetical protein